MTQFSEQQALAVIAPWYSLFNIKSRDDVRDTRIAKTCDMENWLSAIG
jgi:hypothetical protein